MKFFLKSTLCFSFIFIFNQNFIQASSGSEHDFTRQTHYQLKQLYQKKLDLEKLQEEAEALVSQGFPVKRAREICVHKQIEKVFAKKFESKLLPAGKILEQIGGTCATEFYKTNEGVMDDIFTTSDIDWLQKGNAPIIYNETHYVEDEETIHPLHLKGLKDRYTFTFPYFDIWTASVKSEVKRPCGAVQVSLAASWLAQVMQLQFSLTSRLTDLRIGHTLTVLQADGMLTLFDVLKAQ